MKNEAIKDAMNSIENRIRHVYNQGYEDGLKDGKTSVQIDETEVYKLGYENGLTSKEYIQIDKSTAYERGLKDAWDLARKLSNLGFNDTRKEIFGERYGLSIDIIKNFSADEVAAKIEEYEKKQKQEEIGCKTCAYSEHGEDGFFKCHAKGDCLNHEKWASKMTLDEAIKHCEEVADSKCDECGAEHRQLAEWLRELKQMKGEEG